MFKIFVILLYFNVVLLADGVKSTNGEIGFDVNADDIKEMVLSENGLGIGVSVVSANLHVNGNVIISDQLNVQSQQGSSNLNISGTIGFGVEIVTSDSNLLDDSHVLVNPSTNTTLTLPEASMYNGRTYLVKNLSSLYDVSIIGGGNIDGQASYRLAKLSSSSSGSTEFISNGTEWFILSTSSSGEFGPLLGSNLLLWLDANDADTITEDANGNITNWYDKSENSSHATATSGRHPSGNADAINGKKALYFDGSEDMTLSNMLHSESNYTAFTVFKTNAVNTTAERLFESNDGSDRLILWSSLGGSQSTGIFTDTESNVTLSTRISGAQVITWSLEAASSATSYINGVSSTSGSYTKKALENTPTIGSRNVHYVIGDIGELILYDRVLSETERVQVETYLSVKWGIDF